MKSSETAVIKGVQKSGTHVPEKATSTKKAEAKADGKMSAKPAPAAVGVASPVPVQEKSWEGSSEDWRQDYNGAKRKGMTTEQYQDTAGDRVADAAGERRMRAEESNKVQNAPSYKPGTRASTNSPKVSHGYGHPAGSRDGHLRCSGHSGAHRIGKKK